MDYPATDQRNQDAYRELAASINRSYPPGRFVALVDGAIVADAEQFETILTRLREMGTDPRTAMVVQAGVDYLSPGFITSPLPLP